MARERLRTFVLASARVRSQCRALIFSPKGLHRPIPRVFRPTVPIAATGSGMIGLSYALPSRSSPAPNFARRLASALL
jgi:hypothetical protein